MSEATGSERRREPERGLPTLRWSSTVVAELQDRALRGYPREVCGLLIGSQTSSETFVARVTEARNLRTDRLADRYTLDPQDFLIADADARRDGLDVVGIWHTHPDHPPEPSQTDLEAAWEGYSYVILSVRSGKVAGIRSWRLDGPRFRKQSIEEADP